MRTILFALTLCLAAQLPVANADHVTVHGTVGMLEAELVTKTSEQVGLVNVWNDRNNMYVTVTPFDDRCLLSQVSIYLSTDPAPSPVPEEITSLYEAYQDALAECEAAYEECEEVVESYRFLTDEDFVDREELLLEREAAEQALEFAEEDYLDVWDAMAALADEYPDLLAEPDFGEWPINVKFKKQLLDFYPTTVALSDIKYLQWGQWGMPWLNQRLVTVAVCVELKTTDVVPVTFIAWARNPNVPVEVQRTAWGANSLAMRYELQHPSQGQFAGPVHGLHYSTRTQSGIIGAVGGFAFFPGETIDLWIGDVYIGSAPADQRISPLDIFPNLEVSDPAVVNMGRLLLSLDADGIPNGAIDITSASASALQLAMMSVGQPTLNFANTPEMDALIAMLGGPSAEEALTWLEAAIGSRLMRRNVSKSPEFAVDKPKLDIMPVWVPARTANGVPATLEYRDDDGDLIDTRGMAKPLFVTYMEEQEPNDAMGIVRYGRDIITAVSMDDGATWKRFNVSHMARRSSFTLTATGERYPGDCRGPQQKIVDDKILVVWTSGYARGGKPSFSIRTDDDYPYDDPYAVNDVWGVRGRQGSVDYDEDKDVGDQGIGEIPYYALWACRGVLVWEGNAGKYPDRELGDVVWFKPERLTSGRRDAFYPKLGGTKKVGFAIAWQEDPGGLLPGSCKGGGGGWSGATVHKKTDIWYSFLKLADFDKIDTHFVPADHAEDELGGPDDHGQQPEISNRMKWLVPMSLSMRVSDNNTVNTDNLKVELDPVTGLPIPGYTPLEGAVEADFLASEHESEGGCDDGDGDGDHDPGDHNGTGGGWGMARYAYSLPQLSIVDTDLDSNAAIWLQDVDGDYRPDPTIRWYRFINKAGMEKTVAVTADGRPLDGDTGACRPHLAVMPGGYVILGYEETKGLGIPPEGEHGEDAEERPEPDDSGKNIIYHSFVFDQPDRVSAGDVLNLPALDNMGDLIPIYYKDAEGNPTEHFRQYKTEVARRYRSIAQPKSKMGPSRTVLLATYKQGREGSGKPSDIFTIRGVVPLTDTKYDNPYRFENLQRYGTGAVAPDESTMRLNRRHMNMSAATVESMDPVQQAGDGEGNIWNKVGKWKQYHGDLGSESFANPFSDAKGHRGFIRGDRVVMGYSFTPNWGRLGGDHMDFYVRRSFNGGQTWTTDPAGPEEVVHTVIERDPVSGVFEEKHYLFGRGDFEPGRNVSLLKGNSHTVIDPRLVPPMGEGSTVNPTYAEDDTGDPNVFSVAFGTAKVLHGIGEPMGVTDVEKEDILYTRSTDGGSTWLKVPWVIDPDSSSPDAGETVYRWPWLAHGPPHQGHTQVRMHPSGTRFYAIWHQWTDADDATASPHEVGNDIWFRRIDFMSQP